MNKVKRAIQVADEVQQQHEINVVCTYRLWPRSIAPPPYTEQDRRAQQLYAQAAKRFDEMDILVMDPGPGGGNDRQQTSG